MLINKMNKRDKLIAQITSAFGQVELGDGISLHEARLLDDHCYEQEKISSAREIDNEKSWQEISDEKLIALWDTLPFMTPEGFRFYLPSFMVYALKNPRSSYAASSAARLALTFDFEIDDIDFSMEFLSKKISLFNSKQIQCCIDFLEFIVEFRDECSLDLENSNKSLQVFWYEHKLT